jgi:hypothetical protein
MKLNKIFFMICISCFGIIDDAAAQNLSNDTISKKFYYEQGVNCTQFVKQYFTFNETFNSNMPYLLTGNIGYKKIGLRYGTNYQISNNKNTTDGSSSSSNGPSTINPPTTNELNSVTIDNRIGLYFRKWYFKRLSLNFGLDFLISNSIIKTKSESSQTGGTVITYAKSDSKTTSQSTGYGPFLAVNYKVWKSISIGTETALYYISGTSKQEATSFTSFTPNSPFGIYSYTSQDQSGKTTFGSTEIRIPLVLYLYFKF